MERRPSLQTPAPPTSLTRVYGFVTLVTALVVFLFYLFVALAPSVFVEDMLGNDIEGVQRIAGTIPVIAAITIVYVLVSYAFVGLMSTPSLDDYRLISDKHARPWLDRPGDVPVLADMPKVMWSRNVVEAFKENQAVRDRKNKVS